MANNNSPYEQVYNVTEDDNLLSRVSSVVCILVQRGLLIAGFGSKKEQLTLHYYGYNNSRAVWEVSFFEQLFGHEPLLADKAKVKGVFTLCDKQMVVPEELYEKPDAESWLRAVHLIEPGDIIQHQHLKEARAFYVSALPVNITELMRINFKNARTLPLAFYQFRNVAKKGAIVQCCITAEQVCATLHNNGLLLWHQVAAHANAEDIAYQLLQVCGQNNIAQPQVSLRCNTISVTEFTTINDLSQYFQSVASGDGGAFATSWDSAIKLAQQLFQCV